MMDPDGTGIINDTDNCLIHGKKILLSTQILEIDMVKNENWKF